MRSTRLRLLRPACFRRTRPARTRLREREVSPAGASRWPAARLAPPSSSSSARRPKPSSWTAAARCLWSIVEDGPERSRPARMLQLAQRLGLDLTDALARHRKLLTDFLQSMFGIHADAEAHAQHALLACRQGRQHARGRFAQARLDGG